METDLFQDEERFFEQLCSPHALRIGFADVKKNRGAPGVDGITIDAFQENIAEELCD